MAVAAVSTSCRCRFEDDGSISTFDATAHHADAKKADLDIPLTSMTLLNMCNISSWVYDHQQGSDRVNNYKHYFAPKPKSVHSGFNNVIRESASQIA